MRNLLIVAMILVVVNNAYGAEWVTYTNEELYKLGTKSIEKKDWLGALKYLFAYQVRVEPNRDKMNQKDKIIMLKNIDEAEKWLKKNLPVNEPSNGGASSNKGDRTTKVTAAGS
jgi:hypothetical protein